MDSTLISQIIESGPVIWSLLIASIVAVTLIIYKICQFRSLNAGSSSLTDALKHLDSGSRSQALLRIGGLKQPRAQLLAQSLKIFDTAELDFASAQAETYRLAKKKIHNLSHGLRPLEIISQLAPLMGLFGTVLGMIEAFKVMAAAGSQVDPALLSGGIWQALLTTAVGLAVAIPVTLFHGWLSRRLEVTAALIEDDLQHLYTIESKLNNKVQFQPKKEKVS